MAFRTVQEAIDQVARNMSLVNAANVTPYSPELILSYLQLAHEMIIDEQEWDEVRADFIRTLDGTTGRITVGISTVDNYKDIKRVYHESSSTPLPVLTTYNNPLIATSIHGIRGIPRSDDPGPNKKLIQFYPLVLTGQVLFQADQTFDLTNLELELPIDWWLHVLHASWQFALDDGTNPGQIAKYEGLFNERMKQVKTKENSRPVSLDPYQSIPDIWVDSDDPYWIGT